MRMLKVRRRASLDNMTYEKISFQSNREDVLIIFLIINQPISLRPTLLTNGHMTNGISVDREVSSCLGIRENLSCMYILFV